MRTAMETITDYYIQITYYRDPFSRFPIKHVGVPTPHGCLARSGGQPTGSSTGSVGIQFRGKGAFRL